MDPVETCVVSELAVGRDLYIAVVSDTHAPRYRLPDELLRRLEGVDAILHAGDLCTVDVLHDLRNIAPVYAVHGNCDGAELRAELPERRLLRVGALTIALLHGHSGSTAVKTARTAGADGDAACVVFGHSHRAVNERFGDVLFFNPGSPTWPRFERRRTFGLLSVGAQLKATIHDLE